MKKILIIVDMQNDFIDGSLGTKEAQAIIPNVINKIQEYQNIENSYIYVTQDTHFNSYLKTQEGIKLPVSHCIHNTNGWQIQKDINKALLYYKCNKPTNKVNYYEKETFGSINMSNDIFIKHYNCCDSFEENNLEIELVGLCTDICVISNALLLKANLQEAKIIVDASCCAGVTPESHKNALEAMKMCQIEIINE